MSDDQKEKKIMKPDDVIPVHPVKVREGFARSGQPKTTLVRGRSEIRGSVSNKLQEIPEIKKKK